MATGVSTEVSGKIDHKALEREQQEHVRAVVFHEFVDAIASLQPFHKITEEKDGHRAQEKVIRYGSAITRIPYPVDGKQIVLNGKNRKSIMDNDISEVAEIATALGKAQEYAWKFRDRKVLTVAESRAKNLLAAMPPGRDKVEAESMLVGYLFYKAAGRSDLEESIKDVAEETVGPFFHNRSNLSLKTIIAGVMVGFGDAEIPLDIRESGAIEIEEDLMINSDMVEEDTVGAADMTDGAETIGTIAKDPAEYARGMQESIQTKMAQMAVKVEFERRGLKKTARDTDGSTWEVYTEESDEITSDGATRTVVRVVLKRIKPIRYQGSSLFAWDVATATISAEKPEQHYRYGHPRDEFAQFDFGADQIDERPEFSALQDKPFTDSSGDPIDNAGKLISDFQQATFVSSR